MSRSRDMTANFVFLGDSKDAERAMQRLQDAATQTENRATKLGATWTNAGRSLQRAAIPIAATLGASAKAFGDFDSAMTQSAAIMGEISGPQRQQMEEAARAVASTTTFSATQAAESYFFLASAGLDAAQSIDALPAVASFAQAGMFDMARATDILTDAQSALGLASDNAAENLEQMTRVSDVLVKANTLANASVEQFGEALTQKAGAAMRQLNMDVEEGVAVLSVFADAGTKGAAAGTRFESTLEGLTRNARENADAFRDAGIEVFAADGAMNSMADIVAQLEQRLGSMSVEQQRAELAQLGFNRQALAGIQTLLGTSDALREYESGLRDASGITGEIADRQMESFNAQLGLARDRLTEAGIAVGRSVLPVLVELAGAVATGAEAFANLPDPIRNTTVALGAGVIAASGMLRVAGGLATAVGKLAAGVPSVTAAKVAMNRTMSTVVVGMTDLLDANSNLRGGLRRTANFVTGPWGLAFAGAALGLAEFVRRQRESAAAAEALRGHLGDVATGAELLSDAWLAEQLQHSGVAHTWEQLGLSMETLRGALQGVPSDVEVVTSALTENRSTWDDISDATNRVTGGLVGTENQYRELHRVLGNLGVEFENLEPMLEEHERQTRSNEAATDRLTAQAEAYGTSVGRAASDTDDLTGAFGDLEEGADDATSAIQEHAAALEELTNPAARLRRANEQLAEAEERVTSLRREGKTGSDEYTAALWGLVEAELGAEAAALQFSEGGGAAAREALDRLGEGSTATSDDVNILTGDLAAMESQADTAVQDRDMEVRLDGYETTYERFRSLEREATQTTRPRSIPVDADISAAQRKFRELAALARSTGATIAGVTSRGGITEADGGVVDYYATGGLRENHVAQIAPAGAWRVWAEPETGGEAYIPFAPAKRARAVDIWEETGRRLGMVGFADGGLVGAAASGGLADTITGLVRGAKNTDLANYQDTLAQVERIMDRWERQERERQDRQRRDELVDAIDDAEAERAAAESKEERQRASERLGDAQKRLAEFDRQQARAAEEAAAANEQAKLAERSRRVENREQWEFEQLDRRDQIAWLEERMSRERAWTDEWTRLHRQRLQLLDEERQAEKDAAEERARLQAEATRLRREHVQAEADHRQRVADAETQHQERVAAAAAAHQQRLVDAHRRASEEMSRAIDERRRSLQDWIALTERPMETGWASSADALIGNIGAQIEQFDAWASDLADLRARGLGDDVIDALGLADSPEALAQVRELLAATDGEIAELNRVYTDRLRQIDRRVEAEQTDSATQLARELTDIRQQLHADVAELERQHAAQMAKLLEQHHEELSDLQEEWAEEQRQFADELAAIGREQGEKFGGSIADGIRAQIPAIREAADAARAAAGGGGGSFTQPVIRDTPTIRLHSGGKVTRHGRVPGLGPNEVPRILEVGEEVLTDDDPRHQDNLRRMHNGGAVNHGAASGRPGGFGELVAQMRAQVRAVDQLVAELRQHRTLTVDGEPLGRIVGTYALGPVLQDARSA